MGGLRRDVCAPQIGTRWAVSPFLIRQPQYAGVRPVANGFDVWITAPGIPAKHLANYRKFTTVKEALNMDSKREDSLKRHRLANVSVICNLDCISEPYVFTGTRGQCHLNLPYGASSAWTRSVVKWLFITMYTMNRVPRRHRGSR